MMKQVNPKIILRNYMRETAIRKAQEDNNYSENDKLMLILQAPYDEHLEHESYVGFPPDCANSYRLVARPNSIQLPGNQHCTKYINKRGNRHNLPGKPVREKDIRDIMPTSQSMYPACQRALETIDSVNQAYHQHEDKGKPEVFIEQANNTAIDNVHNTC